MSIFSCCKLVDDGDNNNNNNNNNNNSNKNPLNGISIYDRINIRML